jgi:hypothetical protein
MLVPTPTGNPHPFHCMIPSAHEADRTDPLPVLRREMKLLLIEHELLRIELGRRHAIEDELREAKDIILAYAERVEQLSVMEAEARNEAQRMAQKRPRYSRWWDYLFRLRDAVWPRLARICQPV